jgi:dynein light intermediate chain 1
LFYTTPLPTTLQVLRQYALHLLFTPPAPPPGLASGTDAVAPIRNPFPFHHKSNTLDRDRIVVPAGWDSWGKIAVMREGFEARLWGEAWERDLDASGETADDLGAKKLFAALVPDRDAKVCYVFTSCYYLITFAVQKANTIAAFHQPYA